MYRHGAKIVYGYVFFTLKLYIAYKYITVIPVRKSGGA